ELYCRCLPTVRGGRERGRANQQDNRAIRRELELSVDLASVERARRYHRSGLQREPVHVAGKAQAELDGDRRSVTHRVDGEAEQHGVRLSVGDQRLQGRLVDVVLELLPTE